ncbi:[Pyruvate dehydrogenase [acetyl-transferring]]-phosphatase 1, mitochondrial, partial [Leucoagaricus sp. SymC.cos]
FKGHKSAELSEYASQTLPRLIANQIIDDLDRVAETMQCEIEAFDRILLEGFTKNFTDEELANGTLSAGEIYARVGYKGDPLFTVARRAVVGSTALIAFINKARTRVWVASLGDSDAVCGRNVAGHWTHKVLSAQHNTGNPDEVARLKREHPGKPCIRHDRLLCWLSVTRSLGDFHAKAPFNVGSMMLWIYPSVIPPQEWKAFEDKGFVNMPYMSSTPDIKSFELHEGDLLVLASDGLRDSMDPKLTFDERWEILIGLANGVGDSRLGHECISDGDNVAELMVRNALFGTDTAKKGKEKEKGTFRDDISVVVVNFT